MKEVIVNLKEKIEYHYKGEEVQGSFVKLLPPTAKHLTITAPIKQMFQLAAVELSKEEKTKDEKEEKESSSLNPEDVFQLMCLAGDKINIEKLVLYARDLMTCGLVLVEGEEKLTKPLYEKLSPDDFEMILGSFIVNFIAASLLTGQ